MNAYIWVLTYTLLGSNPEHHTLAKFNTKQECEQALIAVKEEKKSQNKKIVGVCKQTLTEKKSK